MDFLRAVVVFFVVSVVSGVLVAAAVWGLSRWRRLQLPISIRIPANLDALGPAIFIGPMIDITAAGVGMIAGPIIGMVSIFGGPSQTAFQNPVWNAWAERVDWREVTPALPPAFKPTSLEPNQDYRLVINLAGLRLGETGKQTVFS
jgi:hypothetical protein